MVRAGITGVCIVAMVCSIWLSIGISALAQDATPAGNGLSCIDVATPGIDAVMESAYGSGHIPGTPRPATGPVPANTLPQGKPADAATIAAVDQVVQTWLACYLSGEELAVLALQSDSFDQDFFGQYAQNQDEFGLILRDDATGTPVPIDPTITITPAQDVRVLNDGRVGGIWGLQGDTAFIILTQEDGAWVVDDVIDIVDA